MNKPLLPIKRLAALLEASSGKVLRRIALALIDEDPDQPRKEFSEASIREMGETLVNTGQLQPIEVIEQPSGRYALVYGARRVRGARFKGMASLDAIVYAVGMTREQVQIRQLIENLQREDMSARDTAVAMAQAVKQHGSAAAVARLIGKSEGQVSKYLSLFALPPMAAELAHTSKDVETLTTLAKIERSSPEAARAIVAEAKATGRVSRERVRELGRSVSDKLQASTRRLFEDGLGAIRAAGLVQKEAPGLPVHPLKLRKGESLQVSVIAQVGHRDAKRFERAQTEHGAAHLYPAGYSREASRVWVQFGASARSKKSDQTPRLQEFPVNAVVMMGVQLAPKTGG
jgi:ParB/RepB/Spo0J family partition protein